MTSSISKSKIRGPRQKPYKMHPNSLNNLIPYKPGENGRNKDGYSVTSRVKDLLRQPSNFIPPNADPKDKTYRDQIARTIVTEAAIGSVPMIKELWDRTDGKVPDHTPREGDVITNNFLFVLPDGTKLSPKALIEGANGNSKPADD